MKFSIDEKSVKMLEDIYTLLDRVTVAGLGNISIINQVSIGLQQVYQSIKKEEDNKETKEV